MLKYQHKDCCQCMDAEVSAQGTKIKSAKDVWKMLVSTVCGWGGHTHRQAHTHCALVLQSSMYTLKYLTQKTLTHRCPLFSHAVENIIMHHHTNIVTVCTHTHTLIFGWVASLHPSPEWLAYWPIACLILLWFGSS